MQLPYWQALPQAFWPVQMPCSRLSVLKQKKSWTISEVFPASVVLVLVKRKTQLQSFPACLALALPQSYQAGLDLYIPRCLRYHSPTRNRLTRTCASLCHKYIPQTEKRRTPCMIIQRKYNDPYEKHTFQTKTTWQQKRLKKRNLHDDSMIRHPETFQTYRQIMDFLMPPSQGWKFGTTWPQGPTNSTDSTSTFLVV